MTNDTVELINEVNRKIGRNLLRFQQIEASLKLILPYIHPDGSSKGLEAFGKYREKVTSKTLGSLIGEFDESFEIPAGFFDQKLEKLVEARNQLVHHFFQLTRVDPSGPSGIGEILIYLDTQFKEAEELYEFMRHQSLAVLLAILDSSSVNNAEFKKLHERILQALPPTFEYIDQNDPTKTVWPNTRVVKMLQLAELHTEKVDDMTLLARAGDFIKSQTPDVTPKEYGLKTLTEILVASGQFDVQLRQSNDQNSNVVLYKSKVSGR
jgi:hypothetical protein